MISGQAEAEMNDLISKQTAAIGGRNCYIYKYGPQDKSEEGVDYLLIQPVDDHDISVLDTEAEHIAELAPDRDFALAAFKINDWNSELSPWEAEAVFGSEGFGSGAEETLKYVTDALIPELKQMISVPDGDAGVPVILGGYSLAGLFSLWAAYKTDIFVGICAASPSVWFPGWEDFAASGSIRSQLVYLSLGDREERTRNPVMRTVGDNIRKQQEILEKDPGCRASILEMNQGNHFKEPDLRTAKGFAWVLDQL